MPLHLFKPWLMMVCLIANLFRADIYQGGPYKETGADLVIALVIEAPLSLYSSSILITRQSKSCIDPANLAKFNCIVFIDGDLRNKSISTVHKHLYIHMNK